MLVIGELNICLYDVCEGPHLLKTCFLLIAMTPSHCSLKKKDLKYQTLFFVLFHFRISHIRDFIIDYQRHQGRRPFTLTASLPFQELLNESLTLEEANLKNAVVVQRLKNNIEPFRSFSS